MRRSVHDSDSIHIACGRDRESSDVKQVGCKFGECERATTSCELCIRFCPTTLCLTPYFQAYPTFIYPPLMTRNKILDLFSMVQSAL